MHPYYHALSSQKIHGGKWEDYIKLHEWFDETKSMFPDMRHRALRHHTEGIFLAEKLFGITIVNSNGKNIPTRVLSEQHVKEDLGRIPTVQDWLENMSMKSWMIRPGEGRKIQDQLIEEKRDVI